ncbi:MAG TPA: 30S ribosomal protein S20 [Alphaproteobacteria bacterium]|jgi:small subunit ribosomal protein S20|nr:30S ribosomal protein S20 [Alphaproteobacteria bacterium]
MPVTKSAKRALRGSKKKESINKLIMSKLEFAVRKAKENKTVEKILTAVSLTDRAAKKKVIHKNKAARMKSQLSKLMPQSAKPAPKKVVKKAKSK